MAKLNQFNEIQNLDEATKFKIAFELNAQKHKFTLDFFFAPKHRVSISHLNKLNRGKNGFLYHKKNGMIQRSFGTTRLRRSVTSTGVIKSIHNI